MVSSSEKDVEEENELVNFQTRSLLNFSSAKKRQHDLKVYSSFSLVYILYKIFIR